MNKKQRHFLLNTLENLTSEDFKKWYETDLQKYIECAEDAKTDDQILLDINNLLVRVI